MKPSVLVALVTVQVLFGLWPTAGAAVLQHVAPQALIGFRTLLGAPIVLLVAQPWRRPHTAAADVAKLAGLAFLGITANQLLFVHGLELAGPVNAVILATLIPALTMLFATLGRREDPSARRVLGIAVALAGAALLAEVERFDLTSGKLIGSLLILGNTSCYAAYLVLAGPVIARTGTLRAVSWVFLFGALEALPWTAAPTVATDWASLPTPAVGWLLFILIGPTVGTYVLNAYALRRVESSVVAVFIYLQPLVGAVAAHLILGAVVSTRAVIAGLVICAGVFLATHRAATLRR